MVSRGIVKPLDRWLESLAVVKTRMEKLNSLKLLVDARRRSIITKWQVSRPLGMPHLGATGQHQPDCIHLACPSQHGFLALCTP
jgi:hypothetical protein